MISLTNRTTYYDVSNLTETLSLNGTVTIADDWRINSFYGQITDNNNLYVGNFSYIEYSNGRSSKNIGDIDTEQVILVSLLINTTLAELKQLILQLLEQSESEPEE